MHILNTLGVAENSNTEWFQNVIANILEVVLIYALVIPPQHLYQLEPKLLLEFNEFFLSQVGITVVSNSVTLIPST